MQVWSANLTTISRPIATCGLYTSVKLSENAQAFDGRPRELFWITEFHGWKRSFTENNNSVELQKTL
jgi:hypothetical protein